MNTLNFVDLTQHEVEAINHDFNFANAFNQQTEDFAQISIIDRLPSIWWDAKQAKQRDLEIKFIELFYTKRGLNSALKPNNVMLHYAASIATIHIANYLSKNQLTVSLIEPCFDGTFEIMKNFGVKILPLKEELLSDENTVYDNLKTHIKTDVIFLIDPNNPTGFTTLGRQNQYRFQEIVRFCQDHNKLLVLDHCFANCLMYDDTIELYDTYQVLKESGIKYMAIEDTGKYLSSQNVKVALLKVSEGLYEEMYNIYTAYILSISPFILNLVTEYVIESHQSRFSTLRELIKRNRVILGEALEGTMLCPQEAVAAISIAWCKIDSSRNVKSTELQRFLSETQDIYILPGTFFYWSAPAQGEQYLRIALARDTDIFRDGMQRLKQGLYLFNQFHS